MAKSSGPVRQRYALGTGEKVNVGGGKRSNYASGGELTLGQKRNMDRAKEVARAFGGGDDEAPVRASTRPAQSAKDAERERFSKMGKDEQDWRRSQGMAPEGMKKGGAVKHADAKQDKAMIDKAIKKAKITPGAKRGGTCRAK